ncbi:MAG: hypothetical protein JKY95_18250 [Planctomycetaceae bacterium]|nr:hypothetical protein [Planctomycetaceae bacterium]
MAQTCLDFESVLIKQMIEDWADDKGFITSDEICLHLEECFDIDHIVIHEAIDQGDLLMLKITTNKWSEPREFALLSTGSLVW